MVIGEQVEGGEAMPPSPQQFPPQKATIENIMSGIENTGAVKMNNHRKKLRQRFDIIKKLGQGTYGKVQLGINKETGQEVAIKTIKKSKIETEADLIRIRREVQIMSSVQHPNIIHIYEVFENREKMVLVMEFAAGGELYDYLSERKVLAEEEARRIFRQVSTAIYYCHKHKICHRDLKLENILLDEHGNAKIADFGLSNVFDEQRLLATFCGSPLYASPEIVKGTPYQGPEVDCWSLGVLLYTLVYGAMPFDGANFKRLVKQISQGDYFEPKKPSRASPLIREMLTVCPSHRANIEQICNHWWVNEGYEESCLDLAEELANQTPVRLDVLLSLAPPSVTADQLLVGNGQEDAKAKDRIQRSHSMGSIVEMGGTEAERRILDMVAAGGEAALMPSPTRTITPAEAATAAGVGSPQAQTKRKLETTVSTENATGAVKKKDKADPPSPAQARIPEDMDVEEAAVAGTPTQAAADEQTAEPVQPTAQEEATKPTDSAAQPNESKFEAQEVLEDLQNLENMCDELLLEAAHTQPPPSEAGANGATEPPPSSPPVKTVSSVRAKLEKLEKGEIGAKPAVPSSTAPLPTVRKVFGKNKTTDLTTAINEVNARKGEPVPLAGSAHRSASSVERKNSLPDESLARTAERRKSRILETAEKFQQLNQQQPGGGDKFKKFVLPGGGVPTVGNYKKEFERKTGLSTSSTFTKPPATTPQGATTGEGESGGSAPSTPPAFAGSAKNLATYQQQQQQQGTDSPPLAATKSDDEVKESDSKSSVGSFSLEDARRSMENSIAMLSRAKPNDSAPSTPTAIDQLCARTESVSMMEDSERERKLKNAREIIGNAIPIGRLRKPPMPFGANGRSTTGTLGINKPYRMGSETPEPRCDTMSIPRKVSIGSIPSPPKDETKTSHAEITLKSATLPRRKLSKPLELQGDAQSKPDHRMQPPLQPPAFAPMRFSTEVQHQMPDLRSAPVGREHPPAFAPMAHQHQQHLHHRANSLEPQGKEQPAGAGPQKPPTYQRTASGAYGGVPSPAQLGRASLSRQSTNESNDSDNTLSQGPMSTNASGLMSGTVSTSGSTTMPIKKSPREYIIPIAVEGGGIVTPRANSLEPSESNASSTGVSGSAGAGFGMKPRLGRPRRLGSLLSEHDGEPGDITSFPRLNRHTSLGRESDTEEPKFHMMHRLRSTRPSKRGTADPNDSASSGEEDDDDGFEILTAENLFSTLLSRVRALTNRLNVNDVNSPRFPASRFMSNLRQTQAPFWHHQDPFGRNLADGGSAANAWRHSMSRDLSTDIDSMFSRSGATLPRGTRLRTQSNHVTNSNNSNNSNQNHYHHPHHQQPPPVPPNSSSNSIRSSYNNRYSYHHQPASSNPAPSSTSSFYKDLASLAAYGANGTGGVAGSDSRDVSLSSGTGGGGGGGAGSNDDESSISSTLSTNGNGYRHQPLAATMTGDGNGDLGDPGTGEENLDLRDLDLSQLRLSKRDLETLSSITPALSQRVQEQLLAQLPPQQARKLSRTLSMQGGGGGTGAGAGSLPTGAAAANQRLYRRSYSNSSGNRSLDATADYGATGGGVGEFSRRRAGSQPRDILSPPPAYQTSAPLYEKYAPYVTSIPAAGADSSSGMSSFVRDYDSNTRKALSPHTTTTTLTRATGSALTTSTTTTPPPPPSTLRYTSSSAGGETTAAPTKRLSRFLRPDFFDTPPKERDAPTDPPERDARSSPYGGSGGSGVTLREGATGRQQRREKLANDTITDRLSYFLEKYGKPDDDGGATPIGDRGRRSVSRSRDLEPEGAASQPEQRYRTPEETLSILQDQLQDLTNMTSLAAGSQMSKLLSGGGGGDAIVTSNGSGTGECQLPGCTECEGKQEGKAVQAANEPSETKGTSGTVATESAAAAGPTKKIVKVKKVKVVKKTTTGAENGVTTSGGDGEAAATTSVVKKVKKVDSTPTDASEGSNPTVPVVKKESKLMRPKSYPYKEPGQEVAKLSVGGDIALEVNGKAGANAATSPANVTQDPSTETQAIQTAAVNGTASVSTAASKLARPKSFPSSKLTPPKELKLLKSPASSERDAASEQKALPTSKAEPATNGTLGAPGQEVDGPSAATSPPKKVKKVIRIVKKVTKTTDASGKVVITTTTMPADGAAGPVKTTKETVGKTVTIKEQGTAGTAADAGEKQSKEKSKSPEKKPKQGFLASIGQRFEKFRDTSKSSKEKKAAAAAAAASVASATTTSTTSGETLPDTAVPVMVPGTTQIVDGVTPDVLVGKPTETANAPKKDKKKGGKAAGTTEDKTPPDGSTIAKSATGGADQKQARKSRIDTVIRNLRELSAGPKLPEVTESKLIKRAVSVEEMPGTFNRCGVTKVLGLFKKIEKDSRNNHHHHRLLNTKSSSHILMGGRTAMDDGDHPTVTMPDLMMQQPIEAGQARMRNTNSLLPSLSRKKPYGGARSDTVLAHQLDGLLANGGDALDGGGDFEQRKCKVMPQPGPHQSQIPVKYGCPGCDAVGTGGSNTITTTTTTDTGGSSSNGSSSATTAATSNNNGVANGAPEACLTHAQTTTTVGTGSSGGACSVHVQRPPPPQDTDRRGRARALTIDLEQAVHSATEKLKRLQQANSIHLSNIPTQQPLLPHGHHSNHNNNYINNPSKTSLSACTTKIPSSHTNHTANGSVHNNNNNTSSGMAQAAAPAGGNNNYSYPPPLPSEMAAGTAATSPCGYSNNINNNNNNNSLSHHYSTLTPSYDSITNYSSGSRSSPYDDNSSSTFLSPSEERELYFDSWSVCSDELMGHGDGTGMGGGHPLHSSSVSPASRRHSSVRLLTPNQPLLHSVSSPVDPDAESVIERIRRKSFYTRFNDTKKPAKRASASSLGGGLGSGSNLTAAGHAKDSASYGYYGAGSGTAAVREKSLSRGGSSSYILNRPGKESSSYGVGVGKYDTAGYATVGRTEHRGYATMVNLGVKTNRSAARLRQSSLDVVAGDYQQHQQPPHYHHHHHHHHHHPQQQQQQSTLAGLSRTGSRLLTTDDGDSLTDGLTYTNLLNNNNNSSNNTTSNHKYTRNTYYESTAVPSPYGTYAPRRRSSFVAAGYGSSNIASSSSSIALDLLKDHHQGPRDGSASYGNLATTGSSSSTNTLSASDNYGSGGGGGGGGSSNTTTSTAASRTIRPYETRSSSLLTPTALRDAGRYTGRYDSGTLTKNYRTRTSSTSKSTDNA